MSNVIDISPRQVPGTTRTLFFDVETRSRIDLTAVGASRYATDPSTEAMCLAYAVNDDPVQLWTPGELVPPEFIEAANNPSWGLAAHNAAFERCVTRHILMPRYGWPEIPLGRWRCTMAMAYASALPGALENVVVALGLPFTKDKAGQAVMRRMCKPLAGRHLA